MFVSLLLGEVTIEKNIYILDIADATKLNSLNIQREPTFLQYK